MHAVIDFVKMEGAGNDYVYVDAIRNPFDLDQAPAFAGRVADRHFGVGADGLILLTASEVADVRMRMWNSDGSQGSMCGNGVRCLAKLAHDHGHITADTLTVETDAGIKAVSLRFDAGQAVGARVEMGDVRVSSTPVELEVEGHSYQYFQVDAGNPHAVVFVEDDPRQLAVAAIGAAIQALPCFPDGVNVEVVQVRSDATIMQRTFERGSGETPGLWQRRDRGGLCRDRTTKGPWARGRDRVTRRLPRGGCDRLRSFHGGTGTNCVPGTDCGGCDFLNPYRLAVGRGPVSIGPLGLEQGL